MTAQATIPLKSAIATMYWGYNGTGHVWLPASYATSAVWDVSGVDIGYVSSDMVVLIKIGAPENKTYCIFPFPSGTGDQLSVTGTVTVSSIPASVPATQAVSVVGTLPVSVQSIGGFPESGIDALLVLWLVTVGLSLGVGVILWFRLRRHTS
ncbi:MAG: hypothetical protein Q8N51_17625 [Gammaproteobacteria bacterium]|nr:hypothetical protein [Gammaproteobacteria bacterium]